MILPFQERSDWQGNQVFEFRELSSKGKDVYMVEIHLDPITHLITRKECECVGFKYKGDCKHITECIEELKKFEEIDDTKGKIE